MAYRYKSVTFQAPLTVSTTETLLQLSTPSTSRCQVWGWKFSFDGVTATDDPILCQVVRQTTLGTGTGGDEIPLDPNAPAALTVATHTYTAEPNTNASLDVAYAHPQGGFVEEQLAVPIILDVSDFLGFRVIPGALTTTTNAALSVLFEE